MSLLSTTVSIHLTQSTYKYYLNLGYDIPKFITKKGKETYDTHSIIEVKVEDLPLNCIAKVFVRCDICGNEYKMQYNRYCNSVKRYSILRCRTCCSRFRASGKNHWNWKEDITDEERIIKRRYLEYNQFVSSVLERDDYTCQYCGIKGSELEVHHLDGYNWCIEKRTDTANGISLCINCHKLFHNIYGHKNNTKEQFMEWMHLKELNLPQYKSENIKYSKMIYCYENKKVYGSVLEYCRYYPNIDNSKIYLVCNHRKNYYTAYGKHFFWVNDILNMSNEELSYYLNYYGRKQVPDKLYFTDKDREIVSSYIELYKNSNR